jgi:hypothetical protein
MEHMLRERAAGLAALGWSVSDRLRAADRVLKSAAFRRWPDHLPGALIAGRS